MTREEALAQINRELQTAQKATATPNTGMARVCARRAAGTAYAYWLQQHARIESRGNALLQLKQIASDETIPNPVREAAARLTERLRPDFTSASTHPIEDALVIIHYFMGEL